jgi:methyl-CpG-binding domain protein 4
MPVMSPYCLLQEHVWPNPWLVLVACVTLNRTRRKQVERVFPEFVQKFSSPQDLLATDPVVVKTLISCLGFGTRRTKTLFKLAEKYVAWDRINVNELPGVGEYASRAWQIFVKNDLGDVEPRDGALKLYWTWAKCYDLR